MTSASENGYQLGRKWKFAISFQSNVDKIAQFCTTWKQIWKFLKTFDKIEKCKRGRRQIFSSEEKKY